MNKSNRTENIVKATNETENVSFLVKFRKDMEAKGLDTELPKFKQLKKNVKYVSTTE